MPDDVDLIVGAIDLESLGSDDHSHAEPFAQNTLQGRPKHGLGVESEGVADLAEPAFEAGDQTIGLPAGGEDLRTTFLPLSLPPLVGLLPPPLGALPPPLGLLPPPLGLLPPPLGLLPPPPGVLAHLEDRAAVFSHRTAGCGDQISELFVGHPMSPWANIALPAPRQGILGSSTPTAV
jgi:hypothetical protein